MCGDSIGHLCMKLSITAYECIRMLTLKLVKIDFYNLCHHYLMDPLFQDGH